MLITNFDDLYAIHYGDFSRTFAIGSKEEISAFQSKMGKFEQEHTEITPLNDYANKARKAGIQHAQNMAAHCSYHGINYP